MRNRTIGINVRVNENVAEKTMKELRSMTLKGEFKNYEQ